MKYFEAEDMLVIHARIIDRTGGSHGVRDVGIVASAASRPRTSFGGKEFYATVFEKAAVYFESIAFFHPFIDGNKRTAIATAARFLFLNGYSFEVSNPVLEKFVLDAVTKKYELAVIADWFQKHSKGIKEK